MKKLYLTAIASVVFIVSPDRDEAKAENLFQKSCVVELSKKTELEKFAVQKVDFIDIRSEKIKENVTVPPIVSFESAIDTISKYRRPTDSEITKLYENKNGYDREQIVKDALRESAPYVEYYYARLRVSATYAGQALLFSSDCSMTKGIASVGEIKLNP